MPPPKPVSVTKLLPERLMSPVTAMRSLVLPGEESANWLLTPPDSVNPPLTANVPATPEPPGLMLPPFAADNGAPTTVPEPDKVVARVKAIADKSSVLPPEIEI